MFHLHMKLFFKNKVLLALTSVFFVFISLYLICVAVIPYARYAGMMGEGFFVNPLINTIALSWFCLLFFLFIGYEYFLQLKKSFVIETADSTLKKSGNTYKIQFLVMESLILVLFGIVLTYVYTLTAITKGLTAEYALFIFICLFLNIFLMSNVGLCIGMSSIFFKKRLSAYIVMFLFALLTGPFGEPVYGTISNYTSINLYRIAYLLSIGPPSGGFVIDYSFVSSVLPYRFCAVFFWILLAVSVFLLRIRTEKKRKMIYRGVSALSLALVVTCAIGVVMPQSKVIRNSDPNEFNFGNTLYYDKHYPEQEIVFPEGEVEPFRILKYDMEFSAFTNLKAEVSMTVDQNNLDVYAFSLYHGYQVRSVTDQDGRGLEFVQDKDYITVKNDGRSIQKIMMKYKGSSPTLYSNVQGLHLPGDFAYYPRAGYQVLYNMQGHCVQSVFVDDNTEFRVRFPYGKKIYSNLEQDGEHSFSGKSNGVTLLSGFYQEREYEHFTIVLPYLDGYHSYDKYMDKSLEGLEALYESDESRAAIENKKIFILPAPNGGPVTTLFQDHITNTSNLLGMSEDIMQEMQKSEVADNVNS